MDDLYPTNVLWLHRLRDVHLIHGVFALAAAGALRAGLSVQLVLDDTRPVNIDRQILLDRWHAALDTWVGRAGESAGDIEIRLFTDVLTQAKEELDLWQTLERFLSGSSLVEYLRASKVVPLSRTSTLDPVVVLPEARALRLRTPLYNWIVAEQLAVQILANEPSSGVVTLGGADEQVLWDLWRRSGPEPSLRKNIGHVFLAKMPLPRPPWGYPALSWRGRGLHRPGLSEVFDATIAESDLSREDVAELGEWLYRVGILLPKELGLPSLWPFAERTGITSVEDIRLRAVREPRSVARSLAEGIGSWFYS